MARIRSFAGALVLTATLVVAGCTDVPTAPTVPVEQVEPSHGLLGDLLSPTSHNADEATVMERRTRLNQTEVVTRTIGRRGGTIHLPEAGLTVVFPPRALSRNTTITVTAPEGNLYGYHFEPEGTQFRRPVTVVQELDLFRLLSLKSHRAVYFEGPLKPRVTVLESLPLWLLRTLGIFNIDHFSGYVIATD